MNATPESPAVAAARLPSGSVPAAPVAADTVPPAVLNPAPLHVLEGLPINPSSPTVRAHLPSRSRQDVLAVHLVVERVEPPLRTLAFAARYSALWSRRAASMVLVASSA